ncbi:hypothetical protein M3223_04045 [Paenibacillus pasadenensis]|uniref:hypothetical protein n=1 Tax=Paenibacillus pasadenensis TaxID=217090 RepID=UPI00203B761D|nr:hypothetical protein [Paenibacillus pasadenensis]MCM3746520.1 hypothetical protein [Paenibacillus pasadenensis]
MGALYQGQANRTQRAESQFGGGLNNGTAPFEIGDNESAEEYGFDTDQLPALTVRKGRTSYGSSGGAATLLLTNFARQQMVRAVGGTLQYDAGAGSWTNIGSYTAAEWDATNFNDKLYLVNGTDKIKWDGSTASAIGGSPPAGAKFITNDNVRLWLAEGDTIYFSKFQDGDNWTAAEDSGSVQYYTPNGGYITALREFYGDKWVWKRDSMAVIKGTSYFNFALVSVSNDIGCVSGKTVVEVGDTLFWLGEHDVYAHQGGKPSPVGEKVRGWLNKINWNAIDKACAFTDGLKYYLCIPTGGSSEPDVRLVYDPRVNIWREANTNENYRRGWQFAGKVYAGDAAGQVWTVNNGETDNGGSITWGLTTGVFDEGYPEAEKQYKELHLQGVFPTGSSVSVEYSTDQGATWRTISYSGPPASTAAANRNFIIPLDTLPLTNYAQFRIYGSGRVTILQMQRYFKVCRVQR